MDRITEVQSKLADIQVKLIAYLKSLDCEVLEAYHSNISFKYKDKFTFEISMELTGVNRKEESK